MNDGGVLFWSAEATSQLGKAAQEFGARKLPVASRGIGTIRRWHGRDARWQVTSNV